MALIEVFHVVATSLPIDANNNVDIPQGQLVGLQPTGANEGDVVPATNFPGANSRPAIGIAGDSRSSGVSSFTPESGSALSGNPKTSLEGALVTGAYGASQRFTQNRVADNYNEVLASGKMTVYHSGGEFWTDQYELIRADGVTITTIVPGTFLFSSWNEGADALDAVTEPVQRDGRFTDEGAVFTNWLCGQCLTAPTSYPSGVPGTETAFTSLPEGGNSLSWGNFLHVKLLV